MKQELCNLFAQEAPEITKRLPSGIFENFDSPTYLDFLRRLAYEVNDILEHGDSFISQEETPFSKEDWFTMVCALKNIKDLSNGESENIGEHITKLPDALLRINGFYALRVIRSVEKAQELGKDLNRFQSFIKPGILSQGDHGYALLYGDLDEIVPDEFKGENVDLSAFKKWWGEQKELASYYNGASRMHPMMLGIGGKTPKELEMEDGIWACGRDEQRHYETAFEILALINKLRGIGLDIQAAPSQDSSTLEP